MNSVLYITRDGENEELRYSLRSLRFMPHDQVVVVGGIPAWVNPDTVTCVPREQAKFGRHDAWVQEFLNARENLNRGLDYLEGQNGVLMNDDFFLTQEVQEVVPWRYGGAEGFRRGLNSVRVVASRYVEGELATLDWCQVHFGRSESYALHTPFPFNVNSMKDLMRILPFREPPLHIRSAYGNYADIGGILCEEDPKITGNPRKNSLVRMNGRVVSRGTRADLPTPYVSTNERSFEAFLIGKQIRALHPEKSPYEK